MTSTTLARPTGVGYTVLVVDDDPRIIELLRIALGAHGFRVVAASNGEEAIKQAFDEQPDIVILDVRLPRRSGYEVCEQIRREPELSHVPVIMVSALTETDARLQGLSRGADDYLPKPFSPKELIAKVRRHLVRAEEVKGLSRRNRELVGELERARDEARRAQEELRRERMVQEANERLAQDLSRLDRPHDVSSSLLFALMTQLGVEAASVLLPSSQDPGWLEPRVTRGMTPERESLLRLPTDGEMARLLVALGRPVRREEMERFPILVGELDPLVAAGTALFIPLCSRGRLLGMVTLGEKSDGSAFHGMDLEMAASLGQVAGVAVEQTDLVRHAEETFVQAVQAYSAIVEARQPGARVRAERVALVAELLARQLGFDGSSALSMKLVALAAALESTDGTTDPLRPRVWGSLRESPGLEREILSVAEAFVELVVRIDAGTPPKQLVSHLKGDRHVLNALEDLLGRGVLAGDRSPEHADGRAA
jgi:DNA-binding response OmpR family regulator